MSLLDFNKKVMAGREMSRKEIFLRSEKDYLSPLLLKPYIMKERKLMTVGKNSYVSLFKHHYSVPKEYVGRRVMILYDADKVEIYCGMSLAATHDRSDIPYTYSWKKECNLPGHHDPYDKDLEELFRCVAEIDNHRSGLPPGSGSSHAISTKGIQILQGDTYAGKEIWPWPPCCSLHIGSRGM